MVETPGVASPSVRRRLLIRLRAGGRRFVLAVAWLAVAVLFSLGAAGVVAGVGGPPGSSGRPELTWRGDAAIAPGLAAGTVGVRGLATAVDQLGSVARGALTALVATDRSQLASAVDDGTQQLTLIELRARGLRALLLALPGIEPSAPGGLSPASELTLGPASRARFSALLGAIDATRDLPGEWATVTSGSLAAEDLTTLLLQHDQETARAATQGRGGDYAGALKTLGGSDSLMARSRALRDRLAPTTDVSTLDQWLARNATYDAALRTLYAALEKSGGIVTAPVRAAFAAEQAARALLPPDTRALVVILGDVARGGINQAVISIETARGQLDTALATIESLASGPVTGD